VSYGTECPSMTVSIDLAEWRTPSVIVRGCRQAKKRGARILILDNHR
jgi:hypothetical protein